MGVAELGEVCRGRFQKLRYTLRDDVGQLEQLHVRAHARCRSVRGRARLFSARPRLFSARARRAAAAQAMSAAGHVARRRVCLARLDKLDDQFGDVFFLPVAALASQRHHNRLQNVELQAFAARP